jgi:hypothetical protein
MSKYADELIKSIQQCIAYENGDKTKARSVRYNKNTDVRSDVNNNVGQTRVESYKLQIRETFDNFVFNVNDPWYVIYENVIDAITEKYWDCKNRKYIIENKVKEFYERFKEYDSVQEAYTKFIASDRLFDD